MRAGFWWGNLKERDHLENLVINGMLIMYRVIRNDCRGFNNLYTIHLR